MKKHGRKSNIESDENEEQKGVQTERGKRADRKGAGGGATDARRFQQSWAIFCCGSGGGRKVVEE